MTASTRHRDTVARMDGRPTTWGRLRRVDPRIWERRSRHRARDPALRSLVGAKAATTDRRFESWRRSPSSPRPPPVLAQTPTDGDARRGDRGSVRVRPLRHPADRTHSRVSPWRSPRTRPRPTSSGRGGWSSALSGHSWQWPSSDRTATRTGWRWPSTVSHVGVPVAIGRMVWNRRRRIERERDLAARDAVAFERARIARELHDVVAHSMSVMVVQAGGARAVLRRDPDEAEQALRSIEETGRTGLAEMRRLLAVEGDDAPSLAPQPGLERLDELLERMRRPAWRSSWSSRARPAARGGHRPVRLPHRARGAHEHVQARRGRRACARAAPIPGRGDRCRGHGRRARAAPGIDSGGRGLIGMRERVAFLGGDLRTGARPGGGSSSMRGSRSPVEEPRT